MGDDPTGNQVSVIVPAYNAKSTIARALESVARQTIKSLEVIVVDDGSTDGTAMEARACANLMDGVSLVVMEQSNLGAGAARNRAIGMARGTYLAFLDADDEWLPEKLERCLGRFAQNTLMLVAHNGWVVSDGRTHDLNIAIRFRAAANDLMHGLYRRGFISTSSVVVRRDAVASVGGFDETLRTGQDFDLWLKLLCKPGAAFEVLDDRLTRYHVSPHGITGNTARRLDDTLRIAERHAPRLYRHSGRFVLSLWFRIIALHAEAYAAFWRNGQRVEAMRTLFMLPSRFVLLTVRAMRLVRRES